MIISIYHALPAHNGYIAGTGDGIVTVAGKPAARAIHLYVVTSGFAPMLLIARQASLSNGHYLFTGLDTDKKYLIIVRDLPPNDLEQRYEPFVWDYVEAAHDLTFDEQQALRESWQPK